MRVRLAVSLAVVAGLSLGLVVLGIVLVGTHRSGSVLSRRKDAAPSASGGGAIHWPDVVHMEAPANVDAGKLSRYSYRITGPIPKGSVLQILANNEGGSVQFSHQVGKLIKATRAGTGTFRLSTSVWSLRLWMHGGAPHTKGWSHIRAYSNSAGVYSWGKVSLSVMCDSNHTTNGWNEVTDPLQCKSGSVDIGGRRFQYEMYDPAAPSAGLYRPLIEQLDTTCTTADLQVAVLPSGSGPASPVQVMMVYSPWQANPGQITTMHFRLPRWSFDLLDSSNAGGSAAYYRGDFLCYTRDGQNP